MTAQSVLEEFGYVLIGSNEELKPGSVHRSDGGSLLERNSVVIVAPADRKEIAVYEARTDTDFSCWDFVYKAIAE